jgi:hypothetical protein
MSMPAVLEYDDDPEKWVTLWPKSNLPWEGSEENVLPDEHGLYPKWDGPALFRRRSEVSPSATLISGVLSFKRAFNLIGMLQII